MQKLVNGELVEMTAAEVAARQAEEAEWAASARTSALAKTLADARAIRTIIFAAADGLQVSAVVSGDATTAQAIETFKAGLRDITKTDLSAEQDAAGMRAAIMRSYARLTAAAPAAVKAAALVALG